MTIHGGCEDGGVLFAARHLIFVAGVGPATAPGGPRCTAVNALPIPSDPDELLHQARHSRARARRAQDMAHFLTQRADVECVRAYASELEAMAAEMERRAAAGDGVH